jgi:hypothetical protein
MSTTRKGGCQVRGCHRRPAVLGSPAGLVTAIVPVGPTASVRFSSGHRRADEPMSVSDRIDHYLSQFDEITRLQDLQRPRERQPEVIRELPHVQVARNCVRYLCSLARARELGRMSGEQVARYDELLRRKRRRWPVSNGLAVSALLMAHVSECQDRSSAFDHR